MFLFLFPIFGGLFFPSFFHPTCQHRSNKGQLKWSFFFCAVLWANGIDWSQLSIRQLNGKLQCWLVWMNHDFFSLSPHMIINDTGSKSPLICKPRGPADVLIVKKFLRTVMTDWRLWTCCLSRATRTLLHVMVVDVQCPAVSNQDACLSVVLAGVAMMQIVGAPCVKAGPSANGKHPAAHLPRPYSRWHGSEWFMSHTFEMGSLKQWHGGECCQHDPSDAPSPPRQLVYLSPSNLNCQDWERRRFRAYMCRILQHPFISDDLYHF